ncbi:hypothetical protein SBV1_2430004 [Verrucomicrobia bacterium]|nr:hypothetical protein SBV1_2430004 [Verrucomicrobiota bacterium]
MVQGQFHGFLGCRNDSFMPCGMGAVNARRCAGLEDGLLESDNTGEARQTSLPRLKPIVMWRSSVG